MRNPTAALLLAGWCVQIRFSDVSEWLLAAGPYMERYAAHVARHLFPDEPADGDVHHEERLAVVERLVSPYNDENWERIEFCHWLARTYTWAQVQARCVAPPHEPPVDYARAWPTADLELVQR